MSINSKMNYGFKIFNDHRPMIDVQPAKITWQERILMAALALLWICYFISFFAGNSLSQDRSQNAVSAQTAGFISGMLVGHILSR